MLLDHFHPPLEKSRDWHGFLHMWTSMLAVDLNRRLPDGWFASPNVQFQIEVDVATMDSRDDATGWAGHVEETGTSSEVWTPPAPTAVLDVPGWSDVVSVEVYAPLGSRNLAAAIEIVSPSNKDRPDSREAFVAKCERYLQTGVGLIIVDVVTERHADLHGLLLERFDPEQSTPNHGLFACSYQTRKNGDVLRMQMWHHPLSLGSDLPVLPLHLLDGPTMPVDLDATYIETCQSLRIPTSPRRKSS